MSGFEGSVLWQGNREFGAEDIAYIRMLIQRFPRLPRSELADTLCEHLGWLTPAGAPKTGACRKLLARLEAGGEIRLPARRQQGGERTAGCSGRRRRGCRCCRASRCSARWPRWGRCACACWGRGRRWRSATPIWSAFIRWATASRLAIGRATALRRRSAAWAICCWVVWPGPSRRGIAGSAGVRASGWPTCRGWSTTVASWFFLDSGRASGQPCAGPAGTPVGH